ncbi:MAG TPA: hypothetical protein VHG92_12070 [Afifellaceae bacterium]|nr:hypothetical protein [Afifellaceae bacterium]
MDEATGDRDEAFLLCEHALALITKADDWTDLEGGSRIGHWSDRRFRAALLVPPEAELEGTCFPHVLEIWEGDSKVLSACWEDRRRIETRTFRRGEWQSQFLAR